MIIGQDKIINFIDNCSFDTFPKSIMLIGEKGSGRHTICNYIAEKFNLELELLMPDEDSDLSLTEYVNFKINEMYTRISTPHLYVIDGDYFISRGRGELNSLLKVLEEPLSVTFFAFLCETTTNVLPTILNRCYPLTIAPYTSETLSTFLTEQDWPFLTKVVHNPGQLMELRRYTPQQIEEGFKYFYNVPGLMKKASYPNVFQISNKKAYYGGKEEKEGVRFTPNEIALFLIYIFKYLYAKVNDEHYFKAFRLTNKLYNDLKVFNIDKKVLFEHYLMELIVVMKQ